VLKEKLKILKEALKTWNKEVYGRVDTNIEDLTKSIEALKLKGEAAGLSEEDCVLRKEYFSKLWLLLKSKDSLEFQKSRSKWLKEGDANTSFFHACIKSRKSSNKITALKKGNSWVSKPEEVKEEIVVYFKKHFREVDWCRPTLDGLQFPTINDAQREALEAIFLEEEVAVVVVDSDGNKSPGPDGFNFNFFKKFWGLLKKELLMLFAEFYSNSKLPSSFSSYFITLIPKVLNPHELKDFHPISLLGSLYKLLAKVLANRLGR
jgi:hypothetical protein